MSILLYLHAATESTKEWHEITWQGFSSENSRKRGWGPLISIDPVHSLGSTRKNDAILLCAPSFLPSLLWTTFVEMAGLTESVTNSSHLLTAASEARRSFSLSFSFSMYSSSSSSSRRTRRFTWKQSFTSLVSLLQSPEQIKALHSLSLFSLIKC